MEVDVAKGRRDWAFSERDKVNLVLYTHCIFIFEAFSFDTTLAVAKITIILFIRLFWSGNQSERCVTNFAEKGIGLFQNSLRP